MPTTAIMAATPMAMPSPDKAARSGLDLSPVEPSRATSERLRRVGRSGAPVTMEPAPGPQDRTAHH